MIASDKNRIFREFIREKVYSLDTKVDGGRTLGHLAVEAKNVGALQILADYSVNSLQQPDINGNAPLHIAAQNDWLEGILFFRNTRGYSLDLKNSQGQTALHVAASANACRAILALPRKYYNCTSQDSSGKTPLHLAAQNGHLGAVRLVSKGCMAIKDYKQKTALELADDEWVVEKLKCCMALTQNKNASSPRGVGLCQVIEWLKGPKLEQVSIKELVTSYKSKKHQEYLDCILRSDIDPNAMDTNNNSILHHLLLCDDKAMVETLLPCLLYQLQCEPQRSSSCLGPLAPTALGLAAKKGWDTVVDMLLEVGANPKELSPIEQGKSPGYQPYEIASTCGHKALAQKLYTLAGARQSEGMSFTSQCALAFVRQTHGF